MLNWKPFYRLPNAQAIVNGLKKIPSHWSLTPLQDKSPRRKEWQTEGFIPDTEIARLILNGERQISSKGNRYTRYWSGFGLRTGEVSGGLVAIDVDGPTAQLLLNAISGGEIPLTVSWCSGKPGRYQILFQIPDEIRPLLKDFNRKALTEWGELKTAQDDSGKPTELLEFRYNRCQSCLPPSRHPETGAYKWINSPDTTTVALAPQWLCELLIKFATREKKLELERKERTVKWAEFKKEAKYKGGIVTNLIDFLEFEILPRLSPEQIFNWSGHNFRDYGKTLKGCPPWRHSASGTSFHVWWDGTHWAWQDKATGEGGGAVQYRWKLRGGCGTPKGKDFVDIVAELALIAGVPMPEIPRETLQLTDSDTAQSLYTKRAQEQEEWELTCNRALGEQKLQWLAQYPERVQWTQERLRSLRAFNPIIQDTQFVELLVKDFFPKEEPQPPIYSTSAQPAVPRVSEDHSLTNLPPGLYTIAAGMGSGKTHLMLEVIRQFREGNFISFRNSLLTQTCYDERVKDIIHFLWDLEQSTAGEKQKQQQWIKAKETWMAACVESIGKCRPKDVLILEEVEKIKNALLVSATCRRNRRERLREFVRHLQRAKHIFCCDADLSGSTLNWLQDIAGGKKVNVIQNVTQRFQWQCYFFTGAKEILASDVVKEYPNKRADFELKLLSSLVSGKKLLIAADSQRWAESIERMLKMVNPNCKGIRIDSITKANNATKDEVNAFLRDPNKWISDFQPDYIIYTPTCEASLDITIEDYFDAVFGYFVHLNHLSCKQMLGRLRTNAPRYIFAKTHAINDDGASKSPLPTVVAKHMFQHNFETIREVVLAEHPEIKDDFALIRKLTEIMDFESGQYKDPHIQALVELKAMDNYSRGNLRQNLASELERCGHIIIWQEQGSAEMKCPTSPIRKEIIKEWALDIANSEDIDIEEAWSIQQSMTANLEDRHKATKAILKERLPEFTLTTNFIADFYLDDKQWISRQELRYLLDHPEIAKTLDCDRWVSALKFDTAWWDVHSNSLVIKALRTLQIPEIAKSGKSWDKNTDWLLEFKQRALAHSKLVNLALGISVKENSDPCYLLRRCLERAGYPVIGRQRRFGGGSGDRIRVYQIDTTALAQNQSIYHDVYQAIEKRFAQKLSKQESHNVSQLDISISPVCDDPTDGDDSEIASFVAQTLNPLQDEESQQIFANVELVNEAMELPDGVNMVQVLSENWTPSFAAQVYNLLPLGIRKRLPFLIKAS